MKVTVSYAQSIDGKIAARNGESRYISEELSLKLNQEMRRDHDAVLVGIGTVLQDDPLLTCRIAQKKDPVRVILDSSLKIPQSCRIVKTAGEVPTIVFYDPRLAQPADRERLETKGVCLVGVETDGPGRLSIAMVLEELERTGVTSVLVEGGGGIITSFLRQGLWDSLVIVAAAKIIGDGVPAVGDIGVDDLSHVFKPTLENIEVLGTEVVWTFKNDRSKQLDSAGALETRTVLFTAPGEVNIQSERLCRAGRLFSSRLMALSPGTERQFFLGRFPQGAASDPEIDCAEFDFTYPFPYGYINVVQDERGGRYFGFLPHSEHFMLERADLIPIPDEIDDETALFIPHTETALSIIHDTRPLLGDRILLTGAGVVGTLTARILRQSMGMNLTVFDTNPLKEEWFGEHEFLSDLSELRSLGSFDRAIEVSGSEEALQLCIDSLVPEGVLTVASWYGDRDIQVNLGGAFHRKRLTLKSSQVSHLSNAVGQGWTKARRMDEALNILRWLTVKDLLTHRFSFSSAGDAYTLLVQKDEVSGLIALIPGE